MNNFKSAIDRTGNTLAAGKINYIRTILCGESLREFDKLASQNTGTNNQHLKFTHEGLLGVFQINSLFKQKRTMRCAMCKPREILFKLFSARLTELNNYLPLFLGLSASNKMHPEELNEILLHAVLNGWAKHAYLQSWYFEMKKYKAT